MQKKQSIFSQGDAANAVFYIQEGKVQLAVCSTSGQEATIALLDAGDFVGEECLTAIEAQRTATAVALTPCTLLKIERADMMKALRKDQAFSDGFVAFLIARNVRIQEDLVDQLLNSSEQRLARALLRLARDRKDGTSDVVVPKIKQEVLAEMVGTTRSRVSFFLNRFRKLGYINYKCGHDVMRVHCSRLGVVLRNN